jgi:hypothetical protein
MKTLILSRSGPPAAQADTPQALGYRMRSDTSQLGSVILVRGIQSDA